MAESYATQYSQTYAAADSDHLAGLIWMAMTRPSLELSISAQQAQTFNDTLVATLSTCNDDPACLSI